MSTLLVLTGLLVTAVPQPAANAVDAAYDDVRTGNNGAAIARIEPISNRGDAHPAQLINLGVAYARQNDTVRARQMFRRAAETDDGVLLETSGGAWVDSRRLALKALAALDRGVFGSEVRTAAR